MPNERDQLLAAVDALLARPNELPPPAERKRLRRAAGVSQGELADVFGVRRETVLGWESGRSEPRPPKREAYARLLEGWAERFPGEDAGTSGAEAAPAPGDASGAHPAPGAHSARVPEAAPPPAQEPPV
ncbi:helix-turn-helix transcriptional regulator, partial [Streptomyces sp. URMC 125]|uniref:helix-turn-helix transcriptional regulator n=1 Tax=Streptomyces sp. URMC 125 TaxID=3423419 RepID=UPI003F1C99CF